MLALVTADAADGLDPDLQPLVRVLADLTSAEQVAAVAWDDTSVDWAAFDAAIIRSTWDYTSRLDEFLAWVDRVAGETRLVNGSAAVRWNCDKRYLADLHRDGVPITPTTFVAPGERHVLGADVETADVYVVKPTVGAGSAGARRCTADEVDAHIARLHADGRTAMVQPYLEGLDQHGETALCFVPGDDGALVLSHAFGKAAILRSTDVEQVGGLFAKEEIGARQPTAAELELADLVLRCPSVASLDGVRFARVDVAPHRGAGRDDPEALVLMELELIEPSFYFEHVAGAAARFGEAMLASLATPIIDSALVTDDGQQR